jgi:hypothetical protein
MNHGTRHARLVPALERIGLVLALAAPLTRATVLVSPFPGWDLDPFTVPSPSSGMGPSGSMLCDLIASFGAVLVLIARWLGGVALPIVPAALFGLGAIGVLIHTVFSGANATVAETWIGSSWLAAMLLGLCLATTPAGERGDRVRAVAGAVFLGFVALLAVRGAQQVFIEHPQTLADFRRNREAIFAAQGWSPGSAMAKAYERRLMQPEATGWFGLANVYATFAAAGTVLSLVLVTASVRSYMREGEARSIAGVAGAIAALIGSGAALYFAGGKGGYAAAAVGVIGVAALVALRVRAVREPKHVALAGGIIGAGVLGAICMLVAFRGVLGDRLPELSLLFRWFYMEAAVRIGMDHLLMGVGPDGFQQAYMLAKNPLSPEDVTSSHNMLLDWFATLGVFGLAWVALWVSWMWRAGAVAAIDIMHRAPTMEFLPDDRDRHDRWTLGAIGAFAVVAGVRIDQQVLTPDAAVTRLAGLLAFCVVGWVTLSALRRDERLTRLALTGAAMAAAGHALIDVAGVWPAAAPLVCMLVGAAATQPGAGTKLAFLKRGGLAMIGIVALLAAMSSITVQRLFLWETWLRESAATAGEVATLHQRWQGIVDDLRSRRPGATEAARAFATELGVRELEPTAIEEGLRNADLNAMVRSRLVFEKLLNFKEEWKIRREASRIDLRRASLLRLMGSEAEAVEAELKAEAVMADALPRLNQTSSELAWLALIQESIARGPTERETLLKAAEALEQAATLAPYELEYALRLMRIYERAGDSAGARRWASKALQLDSALKYDREVKGMSQRDREEAKRLAGLS